MCRRAARAAPEQVGLVAGIAADCAPPSVTTVVGIGPMTTPPVNHLPLPPFTNQRAVCPSCGSRGPVRVNFDRDCARAAGDHYHRICGRCAHDWVEGCVETAPV